MPLVVLIGNNTASAAEDFLIALDDLKGRATVIGERTYGSTGQPLMFDLPGGGSARVCTKRDTYSDGREFVGYGVKPDIEVKRTVEDYVKKGCTNGKSPGSTAGGYKITVEFNTLR
ncbi:S41 family peptidase [Paraflavitalea speifideaquila]|uniref:S41 family peptidase n=1 Tax=Paraflavitalea speifideaquila TaxID=3076558 RepID=UPI0028E19747|nr:S41 family peptidase [Paraflavitalea speifideiaquila]